MKHSAMTLPALLALLVVQPAMAGPYSDEVSKCLVRSTSETDKNVLVKWIFAAVALHPELKSIAAVSEAERGMLNRNAARLFERLLTETCRVEVQQALKYEGPSTIETSFQVLGQVAARGLFSHPQVAAGVGDLEKALDRKKMESVFGPTPAR